MVNGLRRQLSYANVMATLAVFLALAGGVAWALAPNSVTSSHIKDNAVKFRDLEGVKAWNKRVPVTGSDPDAAVARAEADPVPLAKRGTITIYGKCYRSETSGNVFALAFARTKVDGALYRRDNGGLQRLDTATPEQDRNITGNAAAVENAVGIWDPGFDRTTILAAGHTLALNVVNHPAAKNGTLAMGDAPFGAGDRCSFSGFVVG